MSSASRQRLLAMLPLKAGLKLFGIELRFHYNSPASIPLLFPLRCKSPKVPRSSEFYSPLYPFESVELSIPSPPVQASKVPRSKSQESPNLSNARPARPQPKIPMTGSDDEPKLSPPAAGAFHTPPSHTDPNTHIGLQSHANAEYKRQGSLLDVRDERTATELPEFKRWDSEHGDVEEHEDPGEHGGGVGDGQEGNGQLSMRSQAYSEATTAEDSNQGYNRYRLVRQTPKWYDGVLRWWKREISVKVDAKYRRDHLGMSLRFSHVRREGRREIGIGTIQCSISIVKEYVLLTVQTDGHSTGAHISSLHPHKSGPLNPRRNSNPTIPPPTHLQPLHHIRLLHSRHPPRRVLHHLGHGRRPPGRLPLLAAAERHGQRQGLGWWVGDQCHHGREHSGEFEPVLCVFGRRLSPVLIFMVG
jgi:hypothetical protein